VKVEQLFREGKKGWNGGKKLTEERELREKEGEPGEGDKECYQTAQINLDLKGMGL